MTNDTSTMLSASKFQMTKKRSRGFTLVELMIFICILAIVYIIAAANVMALQNEARIARANGDLKTLELAMDAYIKRHNVCPDMNDYQIVLTREMPSILIGHLFDPFADSANVPYAYSESDNKYNFVVYSIGPGRNGSAKIGDDGKIFTNGNPIFVSNGFF